MVPLTPTSGRGGAGGAGVGTPAAALHARTLGLRSAQRRRASDPRAPRMALLQEGGTGTSASSPTSPGSEVHTVGSGSDSSAAAGGSDGSASVESVNSNAAGRGRGGSSSEGTAASSRASELESDEDGSAPSSARAGSHQDMDGGATLMTTPGRHLGRGIGGEAVHDPRTPGSLRLRPRSPLVLHGAASGTGSGTAFTSPLVHNRRLRHIGGAGTSTSSPTPSMYSIGSVTSARTIGASRPLTPGFKQARPLWAATKHGVLTVKPQPLTLLLARVCRVGPSFRFAMMMPLLLKASTSREPRPRARVCSKHADFTSHLAAMRCHPWALAEL